MPKSLNDWLNEGRKVDTTLRDLFENDVAFTPAAEQCWSFAYALPVICADGFWISIQASGHHYCRPRNTFEDATAYTAFELGFPSVPEEALREYSVKNADDLVNCVYAYVPRNVVEEMLDRHGGIVALDHSVEHLGVMLKPGHKLND